VNAQAAQVQLKHALIILPLQAQGALWYTLQDIPHSVGLAFLHGSGIARYPAMTEFDQRKI
jgi:hypothetical protein